MRLIPELNTLVAAGLFFVTLSACAERQNSPSQEEGMTGNRFFDAAASRLVTGIPDMTRSTANCIIEAMTSSGEIGVGEINQATFENGTFGGPARLQEAFEAASNQCES